MGKFGKNHERVKSLGKFLWHPLSHRVDGETEAEVGSDSSDQEWRRHFKRSFLSVFRKFTVSIHQPFPQEAGEGAHSHMLISEQSSFCSEFTKINLLGWLADLLST